MKPSDVFDHLVDVYAWGVGPEHARAIVGGALLAMLVLGTLMSAFYALREVTTIGMQIIKLILTLALTLLLGSFVAPMYTFVFPTEEARAETIAVASASVSEARSWFVKRWWTALVPSSIQ